MFFLNINSTPFKSFLSIMIFIQFRFYSTS
nr:MAG TPA: hypothetical protein [Caudoviricetes sp.]